MMRELWYWPCVVHCPFSVVLLANQKSSAILKGHWLIEQRPPPPSISFTSHPLWHYLTCAVQSQPCKPTFITNSKHLTNLLDWQTWKYYFCLLHITYICLLRHIFIYLMLLYYLFFSLRQYFIYLLNKYLLNKNILLLFYN